MHILFVTDIFDPTLGSEFQVANKFLQHLGKTKDCEVTLLTLHRGKNKENISTWMKTGGIKKIYVQYIPMIFSNTDGQHKSKVLFFLDLIRFYLICFNRQREYDAVWKCGQVNFLFNIFFLFFPKLKIMGPLSGFEYPPIREILKDGDIVLFIKYSVYSAVIYFSLRIFRLAFYLKKELRYILFATKKDLESFPSINIDRGHVISEIDIRLLLSEIKAKPRFQKNVSSKELKLLWVGSLVRRKRPIKAAQLMLLLANKHENISCTMVGNGPLEKKVINQGFGSRSDLNLISGLNRQEVYDLLRESDLVLVTSWREINSVFLFEVLASNTRVLAPDVSGMSDTVINKSNLFELASLNNLTFMKNIALDELVKTTKVENRRTLEIAMLKEEKSISKILNYIENQ